MTIRCTISYNNKTYYALFQAAIGRAEGIMTFERLHARLLETVQERVRNGDLTERGLARLTGISQPHIHNVLKGVRILSNNSADKILLRLKIDVEDLTGNSQKEISTVRHLPLVAGLLGQETGRFEPCRTAGLVCIPALIAAHSWRPVMARLGRDEEARPHFEAGDLVLIDQAVRTRDEIRADAVYVVDTGVGPRLRFLRNACDRLFVISEARRHCPGRWECLDTDRVKGRVIWLSRELQIE